MTVIGALVSCKALASSSDVNHVVRFDAEVEIEDEEVVLCEGAQGIVASGIAGSCKALLGSPDVDPVIGFD
jgi:hypothetical protein